MKFLCVFKQLSKTLNQYTINISAHATVNWGWLRCYLPCISCFYFFTELGNKPDSLQSPHYHLKALKSQTHLRQAIAAINIVYNRKLSMCECNFVYVIYILLWFFCHKVCFMSLQNESWNKKKCTWCWLDPLTAPFYLSVRVQSLLAHLSDAVLCPLV